MRISFDEIAVIDKECAEYVANAPDIYRAFQIVQNGHTKKTFFAFYMKVERLCKTYNGIAAEINFSKVESKGAYKREEKRKHVGRKRNIVCGTKAEPHVHVIVIAVEKDADIVAFHREIGQYLSKLAKKNEQIKRHRSSYFKPTGKVNVTCGVGFYAKYCRRQAESTRRAGAEYNWDYFNDDRFYVDDFTYKKK